MAGFVFGTLVIADSNLNEIAELSRGHGTLEDGYFNSDGDWVPQAGAQLISRAAEQVPGFGIDPEGRAYFDGDRVDGGDQVHLFVDGSTGAVWLEEA